MIRSRRDQHRAPSTVLRRRATSTAVLLALTASTFIAAAPAQAASSPSVPCIPRTAAPTVGLQLVSQQRLSTRSRLYGFRSAAVGSSSTPDGLVHVRVILPTGYSSHPRKQYPVMYYLHGTGGSATTYPTAELEAIIGDTPVILVTPDGGAIGGYTDWFGTNATGYDRIGPAPKNAPGWETFHIRELLPWIDQHLRTTGRRAIEGSSMGGLGAMSYAARHPGLFRAAASFSGAVDTQFTPAASETLLSTIWDPCTYGDPVLQEANWTAHNPTALASRLKGVSLFAAVGNGLPGQYDTEAPDPSAPALEILVNQMTRSFVTALHRANVPVTTDYYGNGTHPFPGPTRQYDYDDMRHFLPQAMRALR